MSANAVNRTCTKCKRPCEGEAFVALKDGTVFHRFCFTCEICNNELPLKFALKNGKYYHTECYANAKANAPKCFKCEGPIFSNEVSVVLGEDTKFHSRCFTCDTCGQALGDRFYSTKGMFYHETCVTCSMCSMNLTGKNFSQLQDGGYICDNCLYSQQPASQPQQQQYYGHQQIQKQSQGPTSDEAWIPPALNQQQPNRNYGSPAQANKYQQNNMAKVPQQVPNVNYMYQQQQAPMPQQMPAYPVAQPSRYANQPMYPQNNQGMALPPSSKGYR